MSVSKHLLGCIAISIALCVSPAGANAEPMELSQSQLRQLVSQKQIIGAEQLVGGVTNTFGGNVIDIRGFFADGRMTYRVLMQRNDGAVVEVLINGQNGRQVSHRSDHGQAIASIARGSRSYQAKINATAANATRSDETDDRDAGSSRNSGSTNSGSSSSDESSSSTSNASNSNSSEDTSASDSSDASSDNNSSSSESASNNSGTNGASSSNGNSSGNNRDNDRNNRGNKEGRGNGNGRGNGD